MNRLFRTLRTIFAFFSLLLFIATVILWIRSQTHLDEITQYRPQRYICLESVEGRLYCNHWASPEPYWTESSTKIGGGELARMRFAHIPFSHQLGPFAYGHATSGPNLTVLAIGDVYMFPHWSIVLFSAILPALSVRRILRNRSARRLARKGLCPGCGYDLRSTPQRCPECGLERSSAAVPVP